MGGKSDGQIGERDADEWLRVRRTRSGAELCYKRWHRDSASGRSLYADEIEVEVSDVARTCRILGLLGFEEIARIAKVRDSWRYHEFRVDRDVVDGLGTFFEIEFHGEVRDPPIALSLVEPLLVTCGITDWRVIDRGYPWMLWNRGLFR